MSRHMSFSLMGRIKARGRCEKLLVHVIISLTKSDSLISTGVLLLENPRFGWELDL